MSSCVSSLVLKLLQLCITYLLQILRLFLVTGKVGDSDYLLYPCNQGQTELPDLQAPGSPALHKVVKSPMAKEVKQASRRRRKSYDMLFGAQATAGLGKSSSSQTLLLYTWHACCCISHAGALSCTGGNKHVGTSQFFSSSQFLLHHTLKQKHVLQTHVIACNCWELNHARASMR